MIGTILRLYTTAMANDVRTPVCHLFGPPGCGKSTFVEQAAELLGVGLHSINVSRISPLELEGVQMPVEGRLDLLLATYWNKLKDGDILFLDEFLRGFPEVYNGLLDILTSRTVAGHKLPKVFIIAASNSVTAYDPALTDRLLHLPVPDPRRNKAEDKRIRQTIVEAIGLMEDMVEGYRMDDLMENRIHPMYQMLDTKGRQVTASNSEVLSPRNLIGQAQLRYVTDPYLNSLLDAANRQALGDSKLQYFFAFSYDGKLCEVPPNYLARAQVLLQSPRLSPKLRANIELNIQLIESFEAMKEATI